MLIAGYDEITKEDLQKHITSEFEGSTYIRFCIDIKHKTISLNEAKEDHVIVAEKTLANEKDISEFEAEDVAIELKDHIIGGSVFLESATSDKAMILISGSSVEQALNLYKLAHEKESLNEAESDAILVFKKFYRHLKTKIAPRL